MKITDPDVIKTGEKDLIDAVKDDLDLDMVKEIIQNRMAAAALSSKGGEIIVHNNEIAFRLDFDIQLSGSLMFDRQGNYISEIDETSKSDDTGDQEAEVSEDLDLDDININDALEEVGPETILSDDEDEILDEDNDFEENLEDEIEEDLKINLPDYDLDDEIDQEDPNDLENEEPETDSEELFDGDDDELEDSEEKTDSGETESEGDESIQESVDNDNIVDDDINDILQESQDFWEQKKDS